MRWWHVRRMIVAAAVLLVLIAVPVASQLASGGVALRRAQAVAAASARSSATGSATRSATSSATRSAISDTSSATKASLVCPRDDREPESDGGRFDGEPLRRGASGTMVPAGATDLTICRYSGVNAPQGTAQFGLSGIGVIDSHRVLTGLTRELDAIKATVPGAAYNCPADVGSAAILEFAYSSPPGVTVRADLSGCQAILNDAGLTRLGLGAPVIQQIVALSAPVRMRWAAVSGLVRIAVPVGAVEAVNSSGFPVSEVPVERHRFRFLIATPGRYEITLWGKGRSVNRQVARLRTSVSVGKTTHVRFTTSSRLAAVGFPGE